MFTLIYNLNVLFTATVFNSFEGTGRFDTNNDGALQKNETREFLASSEAKNVADHTSVEMLHATATLVKENVSPNFDTKRDALSIKAVQYLSARILLQEGKELRNKKPDGLYGGNTAADIAEASGIEIINGNTTQAHLDALVEKALAIGVSTEEEVVSEDSTPEVSLDQESSEEQVSSPETIFDEVPHFEGEKTIAIESGDTLLARLNNEWNDSNVSNAVNTAIKEKFGINTNTIYVGDTFTFTHPEGGVLSVKISHNGKDYPERALEEGVVSSEATVDLPGDNVASVELPID